MKIGRIKLGKFFIYRGHESDRCNLASSQNISCAELKELAADPCITVRIRLAHRADLPDEIVKILLIDMSIHVRFAILSNEKVEISEEHLKVAVDNEKEEEFIRKKAQERLSEGINKEVGIPSIFLFKHHNKLC